MAKKNTPARTPSAAEPITAEPVAAAPKRRRAPAKRTTDTATPSVAEDRVAAMPEPAGERVTPANTTNADSITFVGLTAEPTYDQIAEAAYLRYLSRGGGDGRDFEDWLEAEHSLKSR